MIISIGFLFVINEIFAIRAGLIFTGNFSRHEHPVAPMEPDSGAAPLTEKPV